MAADLGLLSLTHLQKLAQHHQNPNLNPSSWMWSPKPAAAAAAAAEDDDSWEVRAFEEDTNNAMGTTWPPRCYTCTFCRREFKSAQALGGHMNVHRRDRAKLHQAPPSTATPSSSTFLIPTQEFNGGLCFLYSLPNPNGVNVCLDSPSSLLSISPYPPTNLILPNCPPTANFPVASPTDSTICHSSADKENDQINLGSAVEEELDLELRLGPSS